MSGLRPAIAAALLVAAGCLAAPAPAVAQVPPPPAGPPPAPPGPEQIARGRRLFDGSLPLARGGPPCAACHAAATVAAAGGTMGPDLTGVAERIGREGLGAALQTLFFPTMVPLFDVHQLTPEEQAALGAFLESTSGRPSPAVRATIAMAAGAAILCAGLFALTGALGRSRVRSVRRRRLSRPAPRVPGRGAAS